MNFLDSLIEAMDKQKIYIEGKIDIYCIDKFQRFKAKNHYKRSKNIFVKLHGLQCGATFGDWRYPNDWLTWWYKTFEQLSQEEEELQKKLILSQKRDQELLRAHARYRAFMIWNDYRVNTWYKNISSHPYVIKKKIIPFNAKRFRSYLLLPIQDINNQLISLQFIRANSFKTFKYQSSPIFGYMLLGNVQPHDKMYLCEGYATGCSIYEATMRPVIIAFSALNLLRIAPLIKKKYPFCSIDICGDYDEVGLEKGLEAAKLIQAKFLYPDFSHLKINNSFTDFNDLAVSTGINEVRKQIKGK